MKEFTPSPQAVRKRYDALVKFNQGIDLYENVQTNENFFLGKQWEGVKSNGLPTPVFNFLKRVVLFSVANVSTDNLKVRARPSASRGKMKVMASVTEIINAQFAAIFEFVKAGSLIREFCRNAAVDADGCMYTYWDDTVETGQPNRGAIRTEVLMNTQVLFGNPNSRDVQTQPYIIIERRMMLDKAKEIAEANGFDADAIVADDKEFGDNRIDQLGGDKVTVLTYFYKVNGTVHAYECTRTAELRSEWDLGIRLYPITWMNWDYVQDSYHGQAMITGLIPNQIFVNKLFAMCMISLMTLAYPKVIFDKTKVKNWSSRVGASIGVNGSVDNVAKIVDPASVSPQIYQFIELAVNYTQKFLGATDVALGDTRPDNTSAIIALQRAASTPMELTKQNLLQSIEDLGRIYMEFMGEYYGEREVEVKNPYGTDMLSVPFDFSQLKDLHFSVELDVGASSYWSEIASMQTLDNLLMQGKIDTVEYLKRLPAGQITDRETLIEVLEMKRAQMGAEMPAPQGEGAEPPLRGGAGYGALQRKINATGEVPKDI